MFVLSILLMLAGAAGSGLALFMPKRMMFWRKYENRTRIEGMAGYAVVILVSIIGLTLTAPDDTSHADTQNDKSEQSEEMDKADTPKIKQDHANEETVKDWRETMGDNMNLVGNSIGLVADLLTNPKPNSDEWISDLKDANRAFSGDIERGLTIEGIDKATRDITSKYHEALNRFQWVSDHIIEAAKNQNKDKIQKATDKFEEGNALMDQVNEKLDDFNQK